MFDILTTNQNMKILKDALKWQGFTGDIVINKMQSREDKVKADLEKLEKLKILFKEV